MTRGSPLVHLCPERLSRMAGRPETESLALAAGKDWPSRSGGCHNPCA